MTMTLIDEIAEVICNHLVGGCVSTGNYESEGELRDAIADCEARMPSGELATLRDSLTASYTSDLVDKALDDYARGDWASWEAAK